MEPRGPTWTRSDPSVTRFQGTPEEWDGFVVGQQGWTPFHLTAWREVVRAVHGHECPYLVARGEHGEPVGALPLVRVASPVFGHYLVSMPFVSYGGPLGEPEAVRALARRAVEIARAEGADLLELRSRRELHTDMPASHRKITVILDLPEEGPKRLWDDLDSKVRSQVRRPRKEGVEVRFGRDQLEPFYRVFARHMRDLGTPVQPRRLFEEIADRLPKHAWLGAAWLDDEPIAGGYGFAWEDEFELTWASDLIEHRRIAPNMLLYWAFMERACERGLKRFNFGRCSPDGGTHRFKSQWGTRDERLWWYQWSDGGTAKTPSPDDASWSWGPRLWRRLPVKVTTTLGPSVVRYIP